MGKLPGLELLLRLLEDRHEASIRYERVAGLVRRQRPLQGSIRGETKKMAFRAPKTTRFCAIRSRFGGVYLGRAVKVDRDCWCRSGRLNEACQQNGWFPGESGPDKECLRKQVYSAARPKSN